MEWTIDAIINEWDFGDKDKAFQDLVNYSEKILKELNDKEEKLNYANTDEDKKIILLIKPRGDKYVVNIRR